MRFRTQQKRVGTIARLALNGLAEQGPAIGRPDGRLDRAGSRKMKKHPHRVSFRRNGPDQRKGCRHGAHRYDGRIKGTAIGLQGGYAIEEFGR